MAQHLPQHKQTPAAFHCSLQPLITTPVGRSTTRPRRQPTPHPSRRSVTVVRAVPASQQLGEWDVVEYSPPPTTNTAGSSASPSSAVRLGLVQQVDAAAVRVSPLVEEDEGVWVPEADDAESPEQQEQVPLDRVLRIVETVYGQRQDKEHNPHGEHAHDVWQVVVPLSPGVFRGPAGGSSSGSS